MLSKETTDKIEKLIRNGHTEDAIKLLVESTDKRDEMVIMISNRWKRFKRKEISGTEDAKYLSIESNNIISNILSYLSLQNTELEKYGLEELYNFYTRAAIEEYKKNYIPTYYQYKLPAEFQSSEAGYDRKNLVKKFMKGKSGFDQERSHFFFLLGDSGMGKSTFIVNFSIKYYQKPTYWGIFPKYKIVLVWLGHPIALDYIKSISIQNKKDTILLLDALDEDKDLINSKTYRSRIKEIIENTIDFKKVIITTRVQFLDEEREKIFKTCIPRLTDGGGEKRQRFGAEKLYISYFSKEDVSKYLSKKFGRFSNKKKMALKLIESQPKIFQRPLILKNIETLLDNKKEFNYDFEIYDVLINEWINRDASISPDEEIYKRDVLKFSKIIAKYLYLDNKGSFGVSAQQISDLSYKYEIEISDFEKTCRSFISKNEYGLMDFRHKSFFEYFLSLALLEDNEFRKEFDFTGFDFTYLLYKEMVFENIFKPFFLTNNTYELEVFLKCGKYYKINKQTLSEQFNEIYGYEKMNLNYTLLDESVLIYFDTAGHNYIENKSFETILLSFNKINLKINFNIFEIYFSNELKSLDERISYAEIHHTSNINAHKNLRIARRTLISSIKKIKKSFIESKRLCANLLNLKYMILNHEQTQ